MKHLIFKVNSQSLQRLDKFKPATGSIEYLTASFEFNSDWSGTTKTAKFRKGDAIYSAVISSGGSCVVPWEALAQNNEKAYSGKQAFYIWVEGVDGAKVITTEELKIELNARGAGNEQNTSEPTESVYAQFVADVKAETKANADTATEQATKAEASAENAAASAASLKNDYSNALKGYASGAVVRVDDVSPVEHSPSVKVHGKNLLNIPNASKAITNADGLNINGNIANGQITLNGTFNGGTPKAKVFRMDLSEPTVNYIQYEIVKQELATKLHKGTYIFSENQAPDNVVTGISRGHLLVGELGGSENNGRAKKYINGETVIVERDNYYAQFVVYIYEDNPVENFAYTAQPQLEHGETATEYTPYIDPSTVTVTDNDGNTYTPNTDGTVEGITSMMITNGISTDTEGMTIECEYNRDINKVIAKLESLLSN